MKNIIIAIILLLATQDFYAQDPYSTAVQGPITPSVAAMSFGKYADTPINPSNGTMGFSIPLFSVSDGTLSHGISLSYHSGGVRVSELASEVGLGWHLNAGGVISRTVRGLPDDAYNGYWTQGSQLNTFPNSTEKEQAANGDLDTEPDLFFYNINGMSGKFIIDKYGEAIMIPKSNNKIDIQYNTQFGFVGFKLTTTDGTQYVFGNHADGTSNGLQFTIVGSQKYFYDTWFLTDINSFDNKHTINFNYIENSYKYKVNSECYLTKHYDNGQNTISNNCNGNTQEIKIVGKILSSITTPTSTITFSHSGRTDLLSHNGMSGKRVDEITLTNGGECISYDFTHDYFYDSDYTGNLSKRLKLEQVQKKSCTVGSSEVEEPYTFSYMGTSFFSTGANKLVQFFPSLNTKAIDHWGYYNGMTANNSLDDIIPFSSINTVSGGYLMSYGSADRNTVESEMKKGILNKITYPTKGFTEINYEANKYLNTDINQSSLFTLETCSTPMTSVCCGNIQKQHTVNLSQEMINTGTIALTIENRDPNDWSQMMCNSSYQSVQVTIRDINNNYIGAFSTNMYSAGLETAYKNLSDFTNLVGGNSYKFILSATEARGALEITYSDSSEEELAGGLRIKDITTNDGNGNEIIRSFTYKVEDTNKSSGYITNMPTYVMNANAFTALFVSTSVLPLTTSEGSHIFYTEVREDLNGNGYKRYILDTERYTNDSLPTFPARVAPYLVRNGMLKEQIFYNQNGDVEQNNTIEMYNPEAYTPVNGNINMFAAAKVALNVTGQTIDNNAVRVTYYQLRTHIFRPKTVINYLDGVSQTSNYEYHTNDNITLNPLKVTTTNSDNKVTESITKYVAEYEYDTGIKDYFTTNNLLDIPYETHQYVDGELLNGSKTIFSLFNAYPRPSSTEMYERTWNTNGDLLEGKWEVQGYFKAYNNSGLLSQYQKAGWSDVYYYYNMDKLLERQSYNSHETVYDYYPNSSLLQKKTHVDGTSMSYTYDDLMRLSTVTNDNTSATTTTTYHFAPDVSQKSYIKTISNFQADPNNLSQLTGLESRQYLDGLGRPIQSVQVGQGPNGKDLINAVAYDKHGRSKYSYETIESTLNNGSYVTPVTSSWKKSTIDYYNSPLNRTESSTPTDWFASTTSYGTNDTNEDGVINNPTTNQPYGEGKLFKQISTDPQGHTSTSFTDLKGRLILSRKIDNPAYDTYYVYDDKDRLIEIIPPDATKGDINLNYFYQYDGEDKLTRKKMPSKEWMTYKYDDRDLVMAQQDGYLLNNNKWYVYNYDVFGRETKSGFYDDAVPPMVTSNPIISELLQEQTYADVLTDPQILWGKIKTAKTKVLGTNDWITSNFTYDNVGRTKTVATTNTFMAPAPSSIEYFYDGTSNAVKVKEIIKHSHPLETTTPQNIIENYSYIDANGRTTSEWITVNGQATQLNELEYTAKDELKTKYVGGNASNHLQKMDYTYLDNGLLHKVNDGNASGADLFGYQLNYYQNPSITDNTIPSPTPQKNGNISSIQWAQVNQAAQLNAYTYDGLDRLTNNFTHNSAHNTSYGYDVRGNIANLARYGLVNNATTLIDSLSFKYKSNNPNVLDKVTDGGLHTKGYKVNNAGLIYDYDDNGNLIHDPQKGVRMKYNYLDLCEEISWTDGKKIQFTYDAGGTLLRKEVITNTSAENTVIDYISAIEYKANDPYIIHHSEGRFVKRFVEGNDNGLVVYPGYEEIDGGSFAHPPLVIINQPVSQDTDYDAESIESSGVLNGGQINYEASNQIKLVNGFQASRNASFRAYMGDPGLPSEPPIWISEWNVSDHLGNLRLTYSDLDDNGSIDATTEVLQTAEYYPFGLKKTTSSKNSFDNLYGYNGIEEVNDFGLGVNMATFRTLDPALGRWWSVDPETEQLNGLSPYNSMGNNPILNADPEGDLFWAMPHISFNGGLRVGITAGIGAFSATASYGKGGFGASVGLGIGPLSLSYGSGGFNANLGIGINQGGFSASFGGINYGSSGFGINGPSASYGQRFDFGNKQNQEYAEDGLLSNLGDPVDYNQANADKYTQLAYGDLPSNVKIIADGTLAPPQKAAGLTIKDGVVSNSQGKELNKRGLTVPGSPSGKTGSTIYLYKNAFSSKGQLISTTGHELFHARLFNAGIHGVARHHGAIAVWLARTDKTLGVGQRQSNLYWNSRSKGQYIYRNNFNIGDLNYQPTLLLEPLRP